jgi:Icc-related predicted phosphoesterase
MKLLAFSDVHCDLGAVESLVDRARAADVVAGVGDFASVHEGLAQTLAPLHAVAAPLLLVPGNNETADALRAAVADWDGVTVLHGEAAELDGVEFFGLGAGVPTTPWDWSFDLTDDEAEAMLAEMPDGAVLLSHSPPKGHVDKGLGSVAVARAGERARAVLCGHIHELWGEQSQIGDTLVRNLGPGGFALEL